MPGSQFRLVPSHFEFFHALPCGGGSVFSPLVLSLVVLLCVCVKTRLARSI